MTRQPSNSQPPRWYITTAIPYVNARPHLGHALEFVLTDTLACYHWLKGEDIRFLSGTDENSFKNIQAAIWELIGVANKYVAEVKPWALARQCQAGGAEGTAAEVRLATALYHLVETLRLVACACAPFLPATAATIARQLGLPPDACDGFQALTRGRYLADTALQPGEVLFPRLEGPG